jgi:uncharacterized protein (TIGR03437 family)
VTESGGASRLAGLSFVSPHQVNFVMPPRLREGQATVSVVAGSTLRATGTVEVTRTAPGIFTADGSGRGIAAALATRIDAQGGQHLQRSYSCADGLCVGELLDMGSSEDQLILNLYGTGIRGGQTTKATIGGVPAEVIVVSAQPTNPGLDQVNVRVPRSLAGAGLVEVALEVDGKASNTVVIALR